MVDVAFTVEGPWEKFDQIPYDAFIAGLQKRLDYLKANPHELEAFGECDSYEV